MAAHPTATTSHRPFLNGMRSPVIGPLTRFLIGVPLVLLTTQTATFFAWTIQPPMTAAFLGANYWSSALLAILASREVFRPRPWPSCGRGTSRRRRRWWAWCLALGVLAARSIFEDDERRVR